MCTKISCWEKLSYAFVYRVVQIDLFLIYGIPCDLLPQLAYYGSKFVIFSFIMNLSVEYFKYLNDWLGLSLNIKQSLLFDCFWRDLEYLLYIYLKILTLL